MEEKELALQHVSSCINSGLDYGGKSHLAFDAIEANLESYNQAFCKSVQDILQTKGILPQSKFYCLYLLVQATETKNPLFIKNLATSKDLLNKIFQDAQYDKDRLLTVKGSTFFTKSPSNEEKIMGKNYVRLTLEAIRFWAQAFPATEKSDPNRVYTIMFNALTKLVKFPDSYNFIGKNHSMTADFHLRQDFSLESTPQEKNRIVESEKDESQVFALVISCISSGEDYKQNYKQLEEFIANGSRTTAKNVLDVISNVLHSKEYPAKSKFFATFLLVQLTEQNKSVISWLTAQEKLLNKLFQDAQSDQKKSIRERGQHMFSKHPTQEERVYGNSYLNLLIEAFTFWSQEYGSEAREDPNYNFKLIYATLKKKVQIPADFQYVKKDIDTVIKIVEEKADFAQTYNNEKDLLGARGLKIPMISSGNNSLIRLHSAGISYAQIETSLARLDDAKKAMREYLIENKSEGEDTRQMIAFLYDDINQINKKDLQSKLESLFEDKNPDSEKYVSAIFAQGELIDTLNNHHKNYDSKATSYLEFRMEVLQIIPEEIRPQFEEEKIITPDETTTKKIQEQEREPTDSHNINEEPIKSSIGGSRIIVTTPLEPTKTQNEEILESRSGNLLEEDQISPIKIERSLSPQSEDNSGFGPVQIENRIDEDRNKLSPLYVPSSNLNQQQQQPIQPILKERVNLEESKNQREAQISPQEKSIASPNDVISRGIPPLRKNENRNNVSQSHHKRTNGSELSSTRKRISQEKLHASMRNIEQNKSKVKVQDLTEIENSIRNTFLRTGKKPPAFTPLEELKKKIELEHEISQLKREKKSLAKETSMMKTQVLNNSLMLGTEEREDLGGSGVKPRFSHPEYNETQVSMVQDYQQRAEELKRQLEEMNQELKRKEEEVVGLKGNKQGRSANNGEIEKLAAENVELKTDLENLKRKTLEVGSTDFVIPREQEKKSLKSRLRSMNKANEELVKVLEDMDYMNEDLSVKVQELEELQVPTPKRQEFVPKVHRATGGSFQKTETIFGRADRRGRKKEDGIGSKSSIGESSLSQTQSNSEFVMKQHSSKIIRDNFTETPEPMSNFPSDQRKQIAHNNQQYSHENTQQYIPDSIRFLSSGRSQPTEYYSIDQRRSEYPEHHQEIKVLNNYSDLTKRSLLIQPDSESVPRTGSNRKNGLTSSEIYGQLIEFNNRFLVQLRNNLVHSSDPQEFLNFKLCCLKDKNLLHENEVLQIGVHSTLLTDQPHKRKLLRLVLHYGNRVDIPIENFEPSLNKKSDLECVFNPESMNITIEPEKQAKQQIISWIQNVPFECPELKIDARIQGHHMNIRLYLPCLLNKFMEFKYSDAESFEMRWQKNIENVWRSPMINIDENIIQSPHDFQKYFNLLTDLNPQNEYSSSYGRTNKDFGGVFELDVIGIEYLLKVSVFPASKKAIFQVATEESDHEVVKSVLDTLVFLFQA